MFDSNLQTTQAEIEDRIENLTQMGFTQTAAMLSWFLENDGETYNYDEEFGSTRSMDGFRLIQEVGRQNIEQIVKRYVLPHVEDLAVEGVLDVRTGPDSSPDFDEFCFCNVVDDARCSYEAAYTDFGYSTGQKFSLYSCMKLCFSREGGSGNPIQFRSQVTHEFRDSFDFYNMGEFTFTDSETKNMELSEIV